jgi:hypothetical protein
MYTSEQLQEKSFPQLKKIGYELNVIPKGDRRCRQSWIDALVGVNPPLLQLLEASPAVSVEQVQEAIAQVAKTSPGVEVDPVSEAIEVQTQEPLLESKFGRIVYPRPAQEAIAQAAETSPGVEVDRALEPIMETVEASPGVDLVEDELPGCSNCFGDGYVEDEFGFVKFCQCKTEPRLSHQRTQRAIAQAAQKSPGVDCVYGQSETDLNPILTRIVFSDKFLACYSPPQSEIIHYKADTDGQLSLLDFETESSDEPPDPDDFESIDAFREA